MSYPPVPYPTVPHTADEEGIETKTSSSSPHNQTTPSSSSGSPKARPHALNRPFKSPRSRSEFPPPALFSAPPAPSPRQDTGLFLDKLIRTEAKGSVAASASKGDDDLLSSAALEVGVFSSFKPPREVESPSPKRKRRKGPADAEGVLDGNERKRKRLNERDSKANAPRHGNDGSGDSSSSNLANPLNSTHQPDPLHNSPPGRINPTPLPFRSPRRRRSSLDRNKPRTGSSNAPREKHCQSSDDDDDDDEILKALEQIIEGGGTSFAGRGKTIELRDQIRTRRRKAGKFVSEDSP
ncbi:uncharacterized protein JCM6883_006733 [Sporobolomyces salmoneus]|uniref:uncharacterized protein n=1 Tax=Sporobolomyces salmoneus TaxID=183962 RepID=UPI0031752A7A